MMYVLFSFAEVFHGSANRFGIPIDHIGTGWK